MLPLNKPLFNNKNTNLLIEEFIQKEFCPSDFHVTFSTRQALNLIYSFIYKTEGKKNVAVSPLTCVEALYPIINNNHEIHFVDVNSDTLNMNEEIIPDKMDIVQAIHFGGNPQQMDVIQTKKPKLIIEDCAQALGSTYKDKLLGKYGDYGVFSFMKNIYSIGGGLLITNNEKGIEKSYEGNKFNSISTIYRLLKRYLESKCKVKNNISYYLLNFLIKLKPDNTSPYITDSQNNRIIINSIKKQLSIYSELKLRRIENAKYLLNKINNKNVISQKFYQGSESNYHRLYFILKSKNTKEAISLLRKKGVGANHLTQNFAKPYQERLDKNPIFKKYIYEKALPNYYNLHDRIICIPISPALKLNELDKIADIFNTI